MQTKTSQFDIDRGIDTDGNLPLETFAIKSANARQGQRYQPINPTALIDSIRFIGINPPDFTLIDLGCGKGRALIVAAELGFRKAIGVEFAPELVQIAKHNIERLAIKTATVIGGDAAEFEFPEGNILLLLNNPFGAGVMKPVIDNLGRSKYEKLFVIYKNPRQAAILNDSGFLTNIGHPPGWDVQYGVQVWRARDRGSVGL